MIVTVTERATFKRCRWAWDFGSQNRMGMESALPQHQLFLGKLVHKALEHWLLKPENSLASMYFDLGQLELQEIQQRYESLVGAAPSDNEMQSVDEAFTLGLAMCVNYQKKYETPIPKRWTLVQPEQKVLVPVPGTKTWKCQNCGDVRPYEEWREGRAFCSAILEDNKPCSGVLVQEPHFLEAKFDGIVANDKGYLFILEHKTWERHPNHDELASNDQFLAYIWVLKQLDIGVVGGVSYDGLWKRATPPKGRTFDDLFYRTTLIRAEEELELFERQLVWEVEDMARVAASGEGMYNNRRYDCGQCQFERVCRSKMRDEDWEDILATYYVKRKVDE